MRSPSVPASRETTLAASFSGRRRPILYTAISPLRIAPAGTGWPAPPAYTGLTVTTSVSNASLIADMIRAAQGFPGPSRRTKFPAIALLRYASLRHARVQVGGGNGAGIGAQFRR